MAKLFDIVQSKIILDPDVLAIPQIAKVWNRDKSVSKEKAYNEVSYIVFLCAFNSPYRDLSEDVKEKTIIKDVFGTEDWKPDEVIKKAIDKYEQLQETRHLRMLRSYEHIEDEITAYNNRIDLDAVDDFGKPLYNIKDIVQNAEKIGNIIKSISMLNKQVRSEIEEKSARGQTEIGLYEVPKK